jgi:hypothetical protein
MEQRWPGPVGNPKLDMDLKNSVHLQEPSFISFDDQDSHFDKTNL